MKIVSRAIAIVLGAVGLLTAGGCDTIRSAREAQEEIKPLLLTTAEEDAEAAEDATAEEDAEAAEGPKNAVAAEKTRIVMPKGARLPEYVSLAVTNRPDVLQAMLAVERARLALKTIKSERAPQVDFTGGYAQSTQNGGSHFSWRQRGNGTASFSFDLLLCDFGRLDAREAEAIANIAAAELTYSETRLTVFEEVAAAYFSVKQCDALLEVAQTNEARYAEHLHQAEALLNAGETKKLDVLKARLDLSNAHLDTILASNNVTTAVAALIKALGLSSDCAAREDVMPQRTSAFSAGKRELAVSKYDEQKALELAREASPVLTCRRAELTAASRRVDYAVADLLPSISLGSAFSFADPAWNWSWGVTAVQSLLTGFRKTTAVDDAVLAMQSAYAETFAEDQSLSYKLSVAVATRDTARETFDTAVVKARQADENLATVTMEYGVGEASRIDFTDAAQAAAEAAGQRVKAFWAGQAAEAALVKLTGLSALYE